MLLRARLYEYVSLSLVLIPSLAWIGGLDLMERLIGPFFIVGAFFVLFLYAPIALTLQYVLRRLNIRNAVALSMAAALVYAADAGWVIGSWSNPLPGGNAKWLILAIGCVPIFASNLLVFSKSAD